MAKNSKLKTQNSKLHASQGFTPHYYEQSHKLAAREHPLKGVISSKIRPNSAGFTLVELLIVIFASSIIMGVMANIFIDTWKTQINQEARNRIQQKSRQSVDEISTTVRQAISVVDTLLANNVTYTSSSDSVILKYSAIDTASNILPQTDYLILMVNQSDPSVLEKITVADPVSARASQPQSVNINNELGVFALNYYDASGCELIPGTPLLTTENIKVSVTTKRVVSDREISSTFEDSTHLRNGSTTQILHGC